MKTTIKRLQAFYLFIVGLAALLVLLFETETLPTGFLATEAEASYIASLLSIILTLLGTYLALKLPALPKAKLEISDKDEQKALSAYQKWTNRQLSCIAVPILGNTFIYYATYSESAVYALLITLIGMLFCWPSVATFQSKHKP